MRRGRVLTPGGRGGGGTRLLIAAAIAVIALVTHPNPERRLERIQAAINERFPQGVPSGLIV